MSIKDATQDLTGPHEIIIDQNGTVSVRHNQTVEEIDTLRIVDFEEYNRLAPVGNSLFNSGGQEEGKSGNTVVNQGYIEESNVNILDEMVSMIANMRLYESNQKTLRTISESLQRSITEIGRV
ncbi:MAG: hypothetical protein H7A34_02935 [bacterium]|nr:hypothetical protein [bacterium]